MSYNQYGSNPYANQENGVGNGQHRGPGVGPYGQQGGYGQQVGGYGTQRQSGGYGTGDYSSIVPPMGVPVAYSGDILRTQDFLTRIEAVRQDITSLTGNISQIAALHQRAITSPDSNNGPLEAMVSRTQVLNTKIRDQIRSLEQDAARSGGNATKNSQINSVKNDFRKQLEGFQIEELEYKKRYQEQIARQYRIVNPNATDEEVREATTADWGNEGVFQTALQANRTGHATSVLGAVRARHNDIRQIERTLEQLAQLFQDLDEQVNVQGNLVQQVEDRTDNVKTNAEAANTQLTKGIGAARRARKMKWCLCIFLVLVVILVIVLVYLLVIKPNQEKKKGENGGNGGNGGNNGH